jgi:hypothetical protein
MRTVILATALALCAPAAHAQSSPSGLPDLTPEQIDRMADSFTRAYSEGQAWARIRIPLEELYLELREKGETNRQAVHNLRRLALPGVDVAEYGQRGQQIRHELEGLTQYVRRKDKISEPAAAAVTTLTLQEVLQTLIAIERPNQVHMSVAEQGDSAKLRRSQTLYDGKKPRTLTEFTERVSPLVDQECTVDTLGLTEDVYFNVTCRARGKDSYPTATAKSQCSINNDRMRSLRLVLQSKETEPTFEVLVWCSFGPR